MEKSIEFYFSGIIAKQKTMGYFSPNLLRKGASLKQIEKVESEMNLKFNSELKELYLLADGIELDGTVPSGKTGILPIFDFISLEWATFDYLGYSDEEWNTYFINEPKNLKFEKKLFPFLNDGCGDRYWVDLNESYGNYGKIIYYDKYDYPDYVFSSLTSMFKTIFECYQNDVFSIELPEGYLHCDYKRWGEFAYRNEPNNSYWKEYSKN